MSKKILFWLGVFTMSLLVMVQPAKAETMAAAKTEQSATWQGNACGSSTVSANDACYKQLTTCGGLPVAPPSALGYAIVSWSVNSSKACTYVDLNGTAGNYGTVNTTCTTGTFEAATNKCFLYSCPINQNWTLSGTNCTRPDCVYPQTRNATTGVCEAPVCPHTYMGVETSRGYWFSTTHHQSFPSCDVHGCDVQADPVSSVFGVTMMHNVALATACTTVTTPAMTVTITEAAAPTSPEKIDFDKVVAEAVKVDAARTEEARRQAYIAEVVARGMQTKLAADKAAAQAALDAQKTALADVKRKAAELLADPTTTNINNYNNAVNTLNNATNALNGVLTTLQSTWAASQASKNNADSTQADSQAISAQVQGLQDAIAASGQPFNPTEVQQKTAGGTELKNQNTASDAALADAAAQLSAAAALLKQAAQDIAGATKALGELAGAIKRLIAGLPVCVSNPADPICKPVLPFCVEHPNDASCKLQPPTDCAVTPNAPGCKPVVDCKMTPNAPGCMAASAVNACELNPLSAGCAELGEVKDDVPLEEKTININTITPVSVGGAGACPAPAQLTFHGKTYYSSYETYCNFALGIKPIIIAFAWLAAASILIGGFRTA